MIPSVYMFPADERVHEIVWKTMPQIIPDGLLDVLQEGKFDTPEGEQHRIDILTNPDTEEVTATLTAKSLGVFRSDDTSKSASKRHSGIRTYKMTIVDSIMKYKEDRIPHIALMRRTLDRVPIDVAEYRSRKEALQERLVWFEEDYTDEIGAPSN